MLVLGTVLAPRWHKRDIKSSKNWKTLIFLVSQGAQHGAKIDKKTIRFFYISGTIGKLLFLVLGMILRGKTSPKSEVSGSLFRLRSENVKSLFLNDPPSFLLDFSSWRHRFSVPKSTFFGDFFKVTSKSCFLLIFLRFWLDFGAKLEAKWEPKSIKNWVKN